MSDKTPKSLDEQTRRFLDKLNQSYDDLTSAAKAAEVSRKERREKLLQQLGVQKENGSGFDDSYSSLKRLREQRDQEPIELPKSSAKNLDENIASGINALSESVSGIASSIKGKVTDGLSRWQQFLDGRAEEPTAEEQTKIERPAVDTPIVEKSPKAPKAKKIPDVSSALISRMSGLLEKMTGSDATVDTANSWSRLDKLSAAIRSAWVSAIAQKNISQHNGHQWLNEWEEIVNDLHKETKKWPAEQASSWSKWAEKGLVEIEAMRPWFDVAVANEVNPNTILMVPAAFKGKGIYPSAPQGVPSQIIHDLQVCTDYWEYIQSKNSRIYWKNTPAKHAFDECKKQLQDWQAPEKCKDWQDKALNRYTILEGRLTLLSIEKDEPKPQGRKKSP